MNPNGDNSSHDSEPTQEVQVHDFDHEKWVKHIMSFLEAVRWMATQALNIVRSPFFQQMMAVAMGVIMAGWAKAKMSQPKGGKHQGNQ